MKRAVVVLCLFGCAKVPDAPVVESPLFVSEPGGHFQVDGPGFSMRFGRNGVGAPQIPMPESLRIGNDPTQEVLADSGCAQESFVGLALFPAMNITAAPNHLGSEGEIISATITQPDNMRGPAAVQFTVNYETQIRAGAGTETFSGASTFTFYATGRIVRRDQFVPFTADPLVPVDPFGCNGGPFTNNFFLTSYWAFAEPDSATVDGGGNTIADDANAACTIYTGTGAGIAVAWPPGSMTRFNRNGTATHIRDFIMQNSAEIPNDVYDVTSAVQIATDATDRSDCGRILADLADLPLFIEGIDFTTNEDGVYTDDTNRDGQTVSITSGDEVIPRGSAVILNVGQSGHAIVTREPRLNEPAAFIQRLDDTHVLFVFQDELGRDDEITIELF